MPPQRQTLPNSCRIQVNPDNKGVWFDHKEPEDENMEVNTGLTEK